MAYYLHKTTNGTLVDISELLAFAVKNKASDLHLSAGLPPMIRVHGDVRRINLPALEHGGLGYVEFGVGFLEIVSELAKILSFTLRLFGNMFAGMVLLFVIMFLIRVGVPLVFFLLEVLIGLIQALVFALLTLSFISVAMVGHGGHEEGEDGGHDEHTAGAHIQPDVEPSV